MKKYTMVDGNNNAFETDYKSARRFFQLHGGNSVLIISPTGEKSKFEKLATGEIIEWSKEGYYVH